MTTSKDLQQKVKALKRQRTLNQYQNFLEDIPGIKVISFENLTQSLPLPFVSDTTLIASLSVFDIDENRFVSEDEIEVWLRGYLKQNKMYGEVFLYLGSLNENLEQKVWSKVVLSSELQWIAGLWKLAHHLVFRKVDSNKCIDISTDENGNPEIHLILSPGVVEPKEDK